MRLKNPPWETVNQQQISFCSGLVSGKLMDSSSSGQKRVTRDKGKKKRKGIEKTEVNNINSERSLYAKHFNKAITKLTDLY